MELRRGDLVTMAVLGDYGKPRPALVIQANAFNELPSVVVLRLTSDLHDWPLFRVTVEPTQGNGLKRVSQVMVDKPAAVPRTKVGARIGRVDDATVQAVNAVFARFFGLPVRP